MLDSLRDKVAWVTGSAGGIGSAIVHTLHEAGCRVLSTDKADIAGASSARLIHHHCDVTKQQDIDSVIALCREKFGGLDILVNNAAFNRPTEIFSITRDLWETFMSVNVTAYFFCAQAAASLMKERGHGSIVNMSSTGSDRVHPGIVPYATSKGGVRSLTRALAAALGPYGIRVNGVAPGPMKTKMTEHHWRNPEARTRLEAQTPLGRWGEPEEASAAVAYLASDEASFVTGSILRVDGGRSIRG